MPPGSMHPTSQPPVLQDIRSLIDAARTRVTARVNASQMGEDTKRMP